MAFTLASWNINSVRQREALVQDWLDKNAPDVLCLQEIKCEAHQFPKSFAENGWHVEIVGQKAYNGVAVITRDPVTVTHRRLPGFEHDAARYIEIDVGGMSVGNLYLPNGNSGGAEGYRIKLDFFEALYVHGRAHLDAGRDFVFIGDYNVCPETIDCAPGALSSDDALLRPETRAAWRRLRWLGLADALRCVTPEGPAYTFWDYQAGAWDRNSGLRIDHALLSPRLTDRLISCQPDKDERGKRQPSDHVPLVVTFA